ncbi:YadA-like family protein [Fusobacterium necrophorum]|uniref:YadA-like family protein n=1 Tax=Fusobacterium necrophorum TaxID=859 RepID=UPI0009B8466A|nr:YadA-like family protein [Fusobacterium necrophorum]
MEHNLEKDLRRWLKRKISISLATIVVFAITGSIGFAADPITSAGNNEFTGNNTFKGEKQESTFTVEVKGKATDPKDKSKTLEDQESTVKHTLTAVGSYTRADGKKKIHNEIKKRGQLDSDKPEDQIVFHTLDDTGSHLVARGAKKINGQNGQDSSVTIHSKIFDDKNEEIASQTLKHDGIHTVVRNKDSVIANQVKNSIYSHMTGKGMNTVGEKDKFIRQEVKESVVTRLDKDGSSTIVDVITASNTSPSIKDVVEEVEYQMENGKKVRKSKGQLASHILNKNGSTIKVKNGNTIVSEVESGAKLVMDKDASRFTKDLYVGNNVWKDTSAIGNQLVIGNQSNEAKKKDSIAIGFDNSVISEGAVALGKNNVISGQGSVVIGDTNDVSGKKSVAVGALNSVLSKDSVAVGSDNFIDAEGAGSFGRGEATVNSNGTVTHKYKNEGKNSYTFGNYNSIAKGTENNFILGNKVKIEEKINNSVVLGNESAARKATTEKEGKVGDIQFGNFAGQGKPENGIVSVGAKDKERQIINVAAGKVSQDSTDAINGSQLFSAVQKLTDTGLTFQGNDNKLVQRKLGETLALKGEGVTKEQSEKFKGASGNINVKNSKDGELELQLAKDLQNIESISNKKTKIALLKDSIAMNQALHMGNTDKQHQIKYVADGTELTDAVNLKQLKEYNAELEKKGLNFAGNDGKVIHKNLGEQLDIVGSLGDGEDASSQNLRTRKTDDGKLELLLAQNLNLNSVTTGNTIINNFGVTIQEGDKKVTLSKDGLDNGGNKIVNVAAGENETDAVNKGQLDKAVAAATTEVTAGKNIDVTVATGDNGQKVYQVGLKDKITLGEGEKAVEIDGEQGTLKVGNKITMDGTTGKATFGKIDVNGEQGTIGGLTNKTWDPNNYTSGQAATEDQLKVVDKKVEDLGTTIGKGYTFAGDSGSVNKKLGDTVKITGDGKNITTSVTEEGELKVALNKKIEVEQITSEKMIIKDKDGNTTDVGETLKEHSEQIQENSEAIKKGLNFAGNHGTTNKQLGDTMSIKGKEGVSEEDVQSKYDTENVVTTVDKDGNLWIKLSKNPKFNSVEAGDRETKVTIGNDGVKIGDKTYITKDGLNANNQKIVNVADGTIAQDSKDAVNGGQIHNIVQDINNSINQTNQRVDKLDDRMHRGLANSAAMATLEFLEIGINQATVGAAVGTYRGNQAVAVGVQAAPTENTRVHAKVSVAPSRNNTETMAGVGASWRFNWK